VNDEPTLYDAFRVGLESPIYLFRRLGTQLAVESCLTCIERWANSISNSLRVQKSASGGYLRHSVQQGQPMQSELQSSSKQQMATLAVKKL